MTHYFHIQILWYETSQLCYYIKQRSTKVLLSPRGHKLFKLCRTTNLARAVEQRVLIAFSKQKSEFPMKSFSSIIWPTPQISLSFDKIRVVTMMRNGHTYGDKYAQIIFKIDRNFLHTFTFSHTFHDPLCCR